MKKFVSLLLVLVVALSMSTVAFAAGEPFTPPTGGFVGPDAKPATANPSSEFDASQPFEFNINKIYVKSGNKGEALTDGTPFPEEKLTFTVTCVNSPLQNHSAAPAVSAKIGEDGAVTDITTPIAIHGEGGYNVPGKYNYKIVESVPKPKTQGVTYDENPIWLQVLVKNSPSEKGKLVARITFAPNNVTGNDPVFKEEHATGVLNVVVKKGDFKNIYKLDGDGTTDPDRPAPKPEPDPDPKPGPDPLPDPNPATANKLSVMKQVTGPMGDKKANFTVNVYFKSDLPVLSDISYNSNTIEKYDGTATITNDTMNKLGAKWVKNTSDDKYYAKAVLTLLNQDYVEFSNIPAGVVYAVQEDQKHLGKLTGDNVNVGDKGYTAFYSTDKTNGAAVKNAASGAVNITAIEKDGQGANPALQDKTQNGQGLYATGKMGTTKYNYVRIHNHKGDNKGDDDIVKPNTGIQLDVVPYLVILAVVALAGGVMIAKKRKYGED